MRKSTFVIACLCAIIISSKAQNISTFAGTGIQGYSGDGGLCSAANISGPRTMAFDASGNTYISDYFNKRIRKIDPTGIITTFAGIGVQGYSGDGGPAVNAQIDDINGIAVDAFGNVYITDTQNNRIRKINTSGIISTIAGTGVSGYNGDSIPAVSAEIYYPWGIVIDAVGNIYFSEWGYYNHIRKIDTSGIIYTIAGAGAGFSGDGGPATNALLSYPAGMAMDANGNLYFADSGNQRIRKINTAGIIYTIAGTGAQGSAGDGGNALAAQFNFPNDVALDASGNIYIADYSNNKIRKINSVGIISTLAGTGVAGYNGDGILASNAQLFWPEGVETDAMGNIYVADWRNERFRKINCIAPTPVINCTSTLVCSGTSVSLSASGATTYTWSTGAVSPSIIANPTVNSTYSVKGLSNGCVSAPITLSVSVNALPILVVVSTSTLSCTDPTVILTANGASTYTWSNGIINGMSFTPTITTTYTVSGTDVNGCTNSTTGIVFVPRPTLVASNTTMCSGETATLTINGANTYTWSTGANTQDIIIAPVINTTYSAQAMVGNCHYTLILTENVNACTGIEELTDDYNSPKVFPNPFRDRVVISKLKPWSESALEIYNTFGERVYFAPIENENIELELSFLQNGIYFIRMKDSKNIPGIKLIKIY
jgi:sugar lactone lactonase YvrE